MAGLYMITVANLNYWASRSGMALEVLRITRPLFDKLDCLSLKKLLFHTLTDKRTVDRTFDALIYQLR